MGRSKALERIVQAHGAVGCQFREEVCGKDLRQRADSQDRLLRGRLLGAGGRLAVPTEEHLIVSDDDKNHAGRSRLDEEIRAERTGRLELRQRRRHLPEAGYGVEREREREQNAQQSGEQHLYCWQNIEFRGAADDGIGVSADTPGRAAAFDSRSASEDET
jgi:hypothetical protein